MAQLGYSHIKKYELREVDRNWCAIYRFAHDFSLAAFACGIFCLLLCSKWKSKPFALCLARSDVGEMLGLLWRRRRLSSEGFRLRSGVLIPKIVQIKMKAFLATIFMQCVRCTCLGNFLVCQFNSYCTIFYFTALQDN